MSDLPTGSRETEDEPKSLLDRRRVLREIVRTGKYAAPMATVLLMGTKNAVALGSNPDL